MDVDINTHKQCKACGEWLPRDEFYRLARSPDGKHYYCKGCCKLRRAVERVKVRDKKSKISNRQHYRARQLSTESDGSITLEGVYKRDKGICARCKQPVKVNEASIDHIIPLSKANGTHTWDNVQLMHVKCNKSKGAEDE